MEFQSSKYFEDATHTYTDTPTTFAFKKPWFFLMCLSN